MKILIEKYDPNWVSVFQTEFERLSFLLKDFKPIVEHIGSTSVPNLSAKPIIDIMVGVSDNSQLDNVIEPLISAGYIYYEKFNSIMPDRRFFVGLKEGENTGELKSVYGTNDIIPHEEIQVKKLVHIHVWEYNSDKWIRHRAFKEYLINHPFIAQEYDELKLNLSTSDWNDGNEYNKAKDSFLKREERKAITWHRDVAIKKKMRKATFENIPQLQHLFRETVTKINIKDYSKEQVDDWASCGNDENRWEELLQEHDIFICEIDGKIAGYCSINSEGYIHMMFTSKEHQRIGVGETMMLYLFDCAKNIGVNKLTSNVSITARPFFERFGFTVKEEQQFPANRLSLTNYKMENIDQFVR